MEFSPPTGVDPAPDRQKRTTWKEFLRTHWDVLAAADFFSVEVQTALGLVRYYVFFVMLMRLATREVHIAGIIPEPQGPWMKQLARNLTDGLDGMLLVGESSLRRATSDFIFHYHAERNHQGLGNKIIRP